MKKTLTQSVVDGGKYFIPSQAMGAALTVFAVRAYGLSTEEALTVSAGLGSAINLVLILVARYLPKTA